MEYFRDPKNRIQADLAYRLGFVSRQYATLKLPTDQNFAVALDLCILQNLLTTCIELIKAMSKGERSSSHFRCHLSESSPWGLTSSMVISCTFPNATIEVGDVLRHLRNSLSHPTLVDTDTDFPSTGYTTRPRPSNNIERYVFVSSPDTKDNHPKRFPDKEKADTYVRLGQSDGNMHEGVVATPHEGRFILTRGGQPYIRQFVAEMTPAQLHALVMGLSNHLAQPIQDAWDGHTIKQLVA